MRGVHTKRTTRLTELHQQARAPQYVHGDESFVSDEYTEPDEVVPDEFGYVDGLVDEPGEVSFSDAYTFQTTIEKIKEHYAGLLEPYRDQLKRNPGVRPVAMARLEQQRDAEIRELTRKHHYAAALDRAVQREPGRVARAQERQDEQRNMASFANDLGRGGRYRASEFHGRETADAFLFGEPGSVFGSDSDLYRRSNVAQNLGHRVYSSEGFTY
jgi:hypothetical protein